MTPQCGRDARRALRPAIFLAWALRAFFLFQDRVLLVAMRANLVGHNPNDAHIVINGDRRSELLGLRLNFLENPLRYFRRRSHRNTHTRHRPVYPAHVRGIEANFDQPAPFVMTCCQQPLGNLLRFQARAICLRPKERVIPGSSEGCLIGQAYLEIGLEDPA